MSFTQIETNPPDDPAERKEKIMRSPRRQIGTGCRHPHRRKNKNGSSSLVKPANKAKKIFNH